jgi:hypothetical protein
MQRNRATLFLASLSLLLAGCEMTPNEYHRPKLEHERGFVALECDRRSAFLSGLTPAEPVDYAVWVWPPQGADELLFAGSLGTACGGATDRAVCFEALSAPLDSAELRFGGNGEPTFVGPALRFTRGNDALKLTSLGELASTLGTIDTPAEAVLMGLGAGYRPSCDAYYYPSGPSGTRPVADGFQVQLLAGDVCVGAGRLLHVSARGEVREVDREEGIEPGVEGCPTPAPYSTD